MSNQIHMRIEPNFARDMLTGVELGMLEVVTTIDARAKMLTPVLSGNLVNSQKITKIDDVTYSIRSGGGRIPYARRQYFENKRKDRWLEKAAESIVRGDVGKYFRNKGL